MTPQQEYEIEKKLETHRERLENEAINRIERQVEDALEKAQEKEEERIDDLNTLEKLSLHGAAREAHMKKFREDTWKELTEHFTAESDKENDRLVEEYRKELESKID